MCTAAGAALVDHPPVVPAFAFRFDTADRSIVISGDTARCESVVRLGEKADILVHSAFYVPAVDRMVSRVKMVGGACMRHMVLGCATIVGGLLAWAAIASADQQEDVAAIRAVQVRQAEAWNRHDAGAYARLFTEDGDVVNVVGWWWKGRAEIEGKLKQAFSFVFAESTLTITDVSVRFLAADVAVAHVSWTMKGARTPANIPEPRQGIQTQVLQRRAGGWLITAFQNTNGIPEVAFPTGPAAGKASR
jgi:uncharacterized protein (TIGR02246 family)